MCDQTIIEITIFFTLFVIYFPSIKGWFWNGMQQTVFYKQGFGTRLPNIGTHHKTKALNYAENKGWSSCWMLQVRPAVGDHRNYVRAWVLCRNELL
jgi:hypothetical protein